MKLLQAQKMQKGKFPVSITELWPLLARLQNAICLAGGLIVTSDCIRVLTRVLKTGVFYPAKWQFQNPCEN